MSRRKQHKIDGFNDLPNSVNNSTEHAGKWSEFFGNDHPIILELGCGKGDLSLGLARQHPEFNFLGIDIKGVRMWTGARQGLEEGLDNLGFLRCDLHGLREFFAKEEIGGIWITFPDPFPRKKHTKNRMTNERFLAQYVELLAPGATIWFKTDNNSLFEYTLSHLAELHEKQVFEVEVLEQTRDLHASALLNADNGITTDFERRFLDIGKAINYMAFKIAAGPNIGSIPATEKVDLDRTEKAPKAR